MDVAAYVRSVCLLGAVRGPRKRAASPVVSRIEFIAILCLSGRGSARGLNEPRQFKAEVRFLAISIRYACLPFIRRASVRFKSLNISMLIDAYAERSLKIGRKFPHIA